MQWTVTRELTFLDGTADGQCMTRITESGKLLSSFVHNCTVLTQIDITADEKGEAHAGCRCCTSCDPVSACLPPLKTDDQDQSETKCLIVATNLTVEQTQPWQWADGLLAVGTSRPRVGWRVGLTPAAPLGTSDQRQTKYRILATSGDSGGAVLWDSGIVDSGDTLSIDWGGVALPSRTAVSLKVQITDGSGTACDWSEPVSFETALLSQTDWQAQWIAREKNGTESDCQQFADNASPLFRYSFSDRESGQAAASLVSARLFATGLGYFRCV